MIIWSDKFATNIEVVDMQHKNLFELVNKLSNSITKDNINHEMVDCALKILIHYTKSHFNDEEMLMVEAHIDKRFLSWQRMEHSSFIYDIEHFYEISCSDEDDTEKAKKMVRFITSWLIYHTLGTDLLMANQMANIKSGMSPQRAYDALKDHKLDPAVVSMMLDAVMDLWLDAKAEVQSALQKNAQLKNDIATLQEELQLAFLNKF